MPETINYWENSELVRRLKYSLNFAKETIKLLAKDGFSHFEDADKNVPSGKIIGETAILLLFASHFESVGELQDDIEELAKILIPHARSEKILFNLCLHPSLALDLAHPHICLSKIGYSDAGFDSLLKLAHNSHAHLGHERIPYQMIEQEWIRKLWSSTNNSIDTVTRLTLLANPIDLLHGTRDDMYAFTHSLIFLSCLYPASIELPRKKEEILDEVDAMLAKCLDQQDYDLTAELLLSWPLIGVEWSPTAIFALRVLADLENKVGFLPSPSILTKISKRLKDQKRREYLYGTTYHTIYVMGLLCATILKYQWNSPKMETQKNPQSGSSKRIMNLLRQEEHIPHWVTVYHELSEPEQDQIAICLFNISLIRGISHMEFDNVFQTLKLGSELDLTNTAMSRQTAELLDRISLLSNLVQKPM